MVRAALESAPIVAPDTERMSAGIRTSDGRARFVWEPVERDSVSYAPVIMFAVAERRRWRAEYDKARGIQQSRSAVPP